MSRTIRLPTVAACLLGIVACGSSTSPPDVVTVTVLPSALTTLVGETRQLAANDQAGRALTGATVTWGTSAPAVAAVSATGVVTGVGAGSATITATVQGKSGSAVITVTSLAFAAVVTGGAHSCGLTTSGSAYCWGRDEFGQLGAPPTRVCHIDPQDYPCSLIPVAVQGGLTFTQLVAGNEHTCGLTSNGTAYCWGHNNAGQLGDSSTTNQFTDHQSAPARVAGGLVFATLSAGPLHTCGITVDSAAYCWGANSAGQLGDGTTTNRPGPVAVGGGLSFRMISTGGYAFGTTCAVTTGDAAYCWGENVAGQLGIDTTDNLVHSAPVPVTGGLAFASVAAGTSHTCALTSTGDAYCWGANVHGALGDGSVSLRPAPFPVTGGVAFAQLVVGGFSNVNAHTCGITNSGSGQAYCWGDNGAGALGDSTLVDHGTPAPVAGQLSFTALDAGFRHTCGRATTGRVYCWGSNLAGELGNNATTRQTAPTLVLGQP